MYLVSCPSWTKQVECILRKVCRISFLYFPIGKLRVPYKLVLRSVTLSILTLWLICSPMFFPGLKENDLTVAVKFLNLPGICIEIGRNTLADFIVQNHFDLSDRF